MVTCALYLNIHFRWQMACPVGPSSMLVWRHNMADCMEHLNWGSRCLTAAATARASSPVAHLHVIMPGFGALGAIRDKATRVFSGWVGAHLFTWKSLFYLCCPFYVIMYVCIYVCMVCVCVCVCVCVQFFLISCTKKDGKFVILNFLSFSPKIVGLLV